MRSFNLIFVQRVAPTTISRIKVCMETIMKKEVGKMYNMVMRVRKKMIEKGILFRKGPGVKGFEKYSRFSLGSLSQMKKVLQLVKNVHRKN